MGKDIDFDAIAAEVEFVDEAEATLAFNGSLKKGLGVRPTPEEEAAVQRACVRNGWTRDSGSGAKR